MKTNKILLTYLFLSFIYNMLLSQYHIYLSIISTLLYFSYINCPGCRCNWVTTRESHANALVIHQSSVSGDKFVGVAWK